MLRKLRAHVRQQFVGYLALFVALSGSAYAAATIGAGDIKDNAVHSRHIKDGAVGNHKLAPDSVTTGKVRDESLLAQDFKAGELPKGADGAPGSARAYAVVDGRTCLVGDFCALRKTKDVAYVFQIDQGHYCVGVNGISADAPDSVAVVTATYQGELTEASFLFPNRGCVAREFEVETELADKINVRNAAGDGTVQVERPPVRNSIEFTVVIP